MSPNQKISVYTRIILVIGAIFLAANIFLPIWKIELYAPQYPEGLALKIYASKLAGDVDIINGLNHYIGMKTLHTEDFMEFSILKYMFAFFGLLLLVTALIGRKSWLYTSFFALVIFCVVAMADFYRWNYNYGHDLDPKAAIIVPGMAYQPPLIGFKQLLNFGAYSIPDQGGWLMITAGVLVGLACLFERGVFRKRIKQNVAASAFMFGFLSLLLTACSAPGPRPIRLNQDACDFCRMSITEAQFATQVVTKKGRHYVFDDIICLVTYSKDNSDIEFDQFYAADFTKPEHFIALPQAYIIESDSLRSPMGGNYAVFNNRESAEPYQNKYQAKEVNWADLVR